MGFALHTYLKQAVHTQLDWDMHELALPHELPSLSSPISLKKATKYSYYLNVCTTSYSMWSWKWPQWEAHLDWMALNGINMPLAFVGQEKVWLETFKKFNVSTSSMLHFFSGAAFQAWGRMGNVRGSWGPFGEIPMYFIEEKHELQKQILARMREFGMLPALPAFAGHVPEEMETLYPHAQIRKGTQWGKFPLIHTNVSVVEPTDPLFLEIGRVFLKTQTALYNYTSGLYQADMYNELKPPSFEDSYLAQSSKAAIDSMRAADPKATWLMQGWMFFFMRKVWSNNRIKAYLSGVPDDQLIMLDLWSDAVPIWRITKNYFGKSWIYCVLHNFGGQHGMTGNLEHMAVSPIEARQLSDGRMIGMGLSMEGIFQNYVVYALALDMMWQNTTVNVYKWVPAYVYQRYHSSNYHAQKAWTFLSHSVYSSFTPNPNLVIERPRWRLNLGSNNQTKLNDEFHLAASAVSRALHEFLRASEDDANLAQVDSFQYDIVDVTREMLNDVLFIYYNKLSDIYWGLTDDAPPGAVCALTKQIKEVIQDMDAILKTNRAFLLGPWLEAAKSFGSSPSDVQYFEYQARNQITQWGQKNDNALNDYAAKQWAGLVKDYYLMRWSIWLDSICASPTPRHSWNHTTVEDFRNKTMDEYLDEFEQAWQLRNKSYATQPDGNTVEVARTLYIKYVHVT
ncbi:hypothetical protein AC1031_019846 [Aphanomyces cochlioides]|nr:hypothetical protein AC1031_019846 [Aphanomyces cochlioides]